jgi:hypothetical protein
MSVRPKGPLPPRWEPASPKRRAVLADVLDRYRQHYEEDTLPRDGRGIFYDLRPRGRGRGITYIKRGKEREHWYDPAGRDARRGRFGPDEVGPEYVQELVADARRAGLLPETWVADQRAPTPWLPLLNDQTAAEEAGAVMDVILHAGVRLDRQTGQPVFVELWYEAGGLAARAVRVVEPYDVPVYSGAGMDGLKGKRAAAERIAERANRGQRTDVLLIGDHDRHGRLIRDVYEEDVRAWAVSYGVDPGMVEFTTVAVTEEQAVEHDLLDDEGKAEADGLPVPVHDQLIRDAILSRQDPARREALDRRERVVNRNVRVLIEQGIAAMSLDRLGGGS